MESVVFKGFSKSILKATIYSLFWYNLGLVSPIKLKSKYKWMVILVRRRGNAHRTRGSGRNPSRAQYVRNCHQLGRVPTGGEGSGAQVAGQMLQPIVCQIHQYNGSTMGYELLPSPVLSLYAHSHQWRIHYLKVQENLKRIGKGYFHMRAKTAPHISD